MRPLPTAPARGIEDERLLHPSIEDVEALRQRLAPVFSAFSAAKSRNAREREDEG